jgi:multicomponent K+:H+ antiporter subunit G
VIPDLPLWASLPAALLLVVGGTLTLIGSIGLIKLPDFFSRMHGPSMGNTLGTGSVLLASMLIGSTLAGRPVVHELLITLFIVMSSPVTSMMLMQAARYRDKVKGRLVDRRFAPR